VRRFRRRVADAGIPDDSRRRPGSGSGAAPARDALGQARCAQLTLVGKGVCFDTGGLDIKPASAMLNMKKDMGGAANVLALAMMIMDAGLPVDLRVLIPAVENSIAASAFRPAMCFPAARD
jgi:hypothetical protein